MKTVPAKNLPDDNAAGNTSVLTSLFEELKVDSFGIGDMSHYGIDLVGMDNNLKTELPFAISFGIVLTESVLTTIAGGPNPLYLHHYRLVNHKLDIIAYEVARTIEKSGWRALPFPASQVVDWRNQKGHISHKKIGVLAGIGWIGRNRLLIDPRFGAHVRYNTVLTDMPLIISKPLERDCGNCMACVNTCPANAIKRDPEHFDYKGCYEMIDKLRKERNIGHHICGICVAACKGEK